MGVKQSIQTSFSAFHSSCAVLLFAVCAVCVCVGVCTWISVQYCLSICLWVLGVYLCALFVYITNLMKIL